MSASRNEFDREEKIGLLKSLIEDEDAFSDHQTIYQGYLSDPDPEVRGLAVEGLWDYPDPALIDTLLAIASQDPDQQVRNRAIMTLGRYVYEGEMADYDFNWGPLEEIVREDELPQASYRRVVTFLLDIAGNASAPLDAQRYAIESLAFSSEPEIVDLIEQAYHSPHLKMKVSALFAMGRSGMTRWQSYVLDELNSPDPQLQYEAVRAAGELFLDEAVPTLLHLARSAADQDLRHEAIWALGHSSSLEAWQLLEDIANDASEDEETRVIAEDALDEYYMFQEMSEADDELFEDDEIFDEGEEDPGNGRYPG